MCTFTATRLNARSFSPLVGLVLLLMLSACNSSSGSGGSSSSSSGPPSEALISAYAYQMVQATAQNLSVGDQGQDQDEALRRSRDPVPRDMADQDITTPCDSGAQRTIIESGNTKVIYDACRMLVNGVQHEWHGEFESVVEAPAPGFDNTEVMTFKQFRYRQSLGTRFHDMTMNGEQTLLYTWGVKIAGEADVTMAMDYRCARTEESFDYAFTGAFHIDYHAEGYRYKASGDGAISGHSSLSGPFSYETLAPLEYADDGSVYPYQGSMRVTAGGSAPVTLRFEQSGAYINDRFYTWGEFGDLAESPFVDPLTCLAGATAPGGTVPGGGNMAFKVDGQSFSGNAAAVYSPAGKSLSISFSEATSNQSKALSLSLREFDGPGIYPVMLTESWAFWIEAGHSSVDTWTFDASGAGSIVVTEFTEERVSGSFDLRLVADSDNDPDRQADVQITDGTFSIRDYTVFTP